MLFVLSSLLLFDNTKSAAQSLVDDLFHAFTAFFTQSVDLHFQFVIDFHGLSHLKCLC